MSCKERFERSCFLLPRPALPAGAVLSLEGPSLAFEKRVDFCFRFAQCVVCGGETMHGPSTDQRDFWFQSFDSHAEGLTHQRNENCITAIC